MSTQIRPPRTRSTGGRTLMLLGVLLALAAGTIVIYVVSSAVGPSTHTVTVVVAAKQVNAGTILSTTTSNTNYTLISDAFTLKQVDSGFVPTDAYPFTNQTKLQSDLGDQVVVGTFYPGDILRQPDPRLVPLGQAAPGSLTNRNPGALPKGDVLFPMRVDNLQQLGLVPGDHVDILANFCGTSTGSSCSCSATICERQTTFQNIYVYAVQQSLVYLVVSHQDALDMKTLMEDSTLTFVLRSPADTDVVSTTPSTGPSVARRFHVTAQP
jgi:Flp pilus assembly protein CpaB